MRAWARLWAAARRRVCSAAKQATVKLTVLFFVISIGLYLGYIATTGGSVVDTSKPNLSLTAVSKQADAQKSADAKPAADAKTPATPADKK